MADLTTVVLTVDDPETDMEAADVAATAGGDTAEIAPGNFLVINNGSGGSITTTIATPGTVDGLAIADATVVTAAGKIGIIPLASIFRQATGRANITYSAVADLTVAVYQVGA